MSSAAALHTGEVRGGRFDPEVFVNCLQNDKDKDLRVKTSCSHLPVCKAAVLLIKSHVDSRNTAMSLHQIIKHAMLLRYYGRYCVKIIMQRIY